MKENDINVKETFIIFLLAVSMLLIGMICCIRENVFASELLDIRSKRTEYYSETPGGKVYIESVVARYYLFLPNEIDTKHVTINTEEKDRTICFVVDGEECEEIDLTKLKKSNVTVNVTVNVKDVNGNLKKSFKLRIMHGTGIGTLYYTSDDPKDHGRAWIEESKQNRGSGKVIAFDAEGNNLTPEDKSQVVTDIHGRGSSSWNEPKRPYQIKFDKKISLINDTAKEKKWVLLGQYKDPLRMSDVINKRIANITRTDFSPKAD